MRSGVLAALPYPVQVIVGLLAYRGVMQTLYGQGTSRFSAEEMIVFEKEIWENVNALLVAAKKKMETETEEKVPFWVLGGKGPSEADTTLFGFIAAAMVCDAYVPSFSSKDDHVCGEDRADGLLLGRLRRIRW